MTAWTVVRTTDDPSEWSAHVDMDMTRQAALDLADDANAGPDGCVVGSFAATYYAVPADVVQRHDGDSWTRESVALHSPPAHRRRQGS